MSQTHPYEQLTPDVILDAVESFGVRCTGGLLALNSYENRVYRVDLEDSGPCVAKFYRPQRWSDAAILEEHEFTLELAAHEIPVVAPRQRQDGLSLCRHREFRFSVYPWQPGRTPELNYAEQREQLGRYLGRLHRFGAAQPFRHRPRLSVESFGREPVEFVLAAGMIPDYLQESYRTLTATLLDIIAQQFAASSARLIRLHGDCHLSNILWTEDGPHIVDFDDCRQGPAVQDLWMLLAGSRQEMEAQLADVLRGYTQFMDFAADELALIEALRTLRMLHYSAWLARRWDDPAFPHNFPWFNTIRYWEEQILALREQQALLQEPPLAWAAD